MQQILETERLRIRPLSVEDSKFILELVNTEGWLKFIGDRNVKGIPDAIEYIERNQFKPFSASRYQII